MVISMEDQHPPLKQGGKLLKKRKFESNTSYTAGGAVSTATLYTAIPDSISTKSSTFSRNKVPLLSPVFVILPVLLFKSFILETIE